MPTSGQFSSPNILYSILDRWDGLARTYTHLVAGGDRRRRNPKRSESFSVVTTFSLLVLILVSDFAAGMRTCGWPGFFPASALPLWRWLFAWFILFFLAVLFLAGCRHSYRCTERMSQICAGLFRSRLCQHVSDRGSSFCPRRTGHLCVGIATAVGFLLQFLVLVPAAAIAGHPLPANLQFSPPGYRQAIAPGYSSVLVPGGGQCVLGNGAQSGSRGFLPALSPR